MTECLKNATDSGLITLDTVKDADDNPKSRTVTVIPGIRVGGPGQATFRNLALSTAEGGAGNWYIRFGGKPVSTTNYDVILKPGEFFTEQDPPVGEITAIHDDPTNSDADSLHFYTSWRQC